MEVFVLVVERGSFAAAAEELNLSAPMIGKHIRALEDRLSARLLTKTTRRQSVTEIGRSYYEHCKAVLGEIDAAESRIEQLGSAPRGMLRINAPTTFGSLRLAPALADFLRAYPQIEVDLVLSDHVSDLVAEGYDAVFRLGEMRDETLTARPLLPYQMILCAAPSYLEAHGTPLAPADLTAAQCLNFSLWTYQKGWGMAEIAAGLPAGQFRCNNGQALRMIAIEGAGVILQPEMLLEADLKAGRLVRILKDFEPPPMPLSLLYVRGRHVAPKLRAFVDFVLARFR